MIPIEPPPALNAGAPGEEQLAQLARYLLRLARQLEHALNNVDEQNLTDKMVMRLNGMATGENLKKTQAATEEQFKSMSVSLAGKADASELSGQISAVNAALAGKANASTVDGQISAVSAALAGKADASTVNAQISAINTALDGKADAGGITEVGMQIGSLESRVAALEQMMGGG